MKDLYLSIFLITFTFGPLSVKGQAPSYVPTSGLAAWYSFIGSAADSSGNGSKPPTWPPGTVSSGICFATGTPQDMKKVVFLPKWQIV